MNAQHPLAVDLISETLKSVKAYVPLCAMKRGFLEELLRHSEIKILCPAALVFKRGEVGDCHYYLLSGQIRNVYASGFSETVNAGDTLYPLSDEQTPSFDCVAETDASVLVVRSDQLDRILSWSQISEYVLSLLASKRDFDEEIGWIEKVLNSNLFYKAPPVNADRIISRMKSEKVLSGDVVVREGEIGKCCYFIKHGHALVTRADSSGKPLDVARIGPGRCFGEDSLVYETTRNATVTMESSGELMCLTKDDFKMLVQEPTIEDISEKEISECVEPPILVDVRSQEEYDIGHLAVSANIPLDLLGLKQRLLRPHIPYVFYCDTGRRSRAAAFLLGKQGYNTVALRGGLIGAGMQYQLVSDFSYVLKDGCLVRSN